MYVLYIELVDAIWYLDNYQPNEVIELWTGASVTPGDWSFYIDFELSDDLEHDHTNLYRNSQNPILYSYCSCKLQSHTHGYCYDSYDDELHLRQCRCQASASFHDHVYSDIDIIGNNYYAICEYCRYSKLVDETFVPIV